MIGQQNTPRTSAHTNPGSHGAPHINVAGARRPRRFRPHDRHLSGLFVRNENPGRKRERSQGRYANEASRCPRCPCGHRVERHSTAGVCYGVCALGRGRAGRRKQTITQVRTEQGRQDSNLQPPVLETGALPIELRPSVAGPDSIGAALRHHLRVGGAGLVVLFSVLTLAFAAIALAGAEAGRWVIAVAAAAIAAWMASVAWSALRRMRR